MSTLEALHELRRMAAADWPAYVYADNGTRLALSNVTGRIGLYDGPDGFAFTQAEAWAYSTKRDAL